MAPRETQHTVHPAIESLTEVLKALAQSAAELGDEDDYEIVDQCQLVVERLSHFPQQQQADLDWDEVRDVAVKLIQREHEFALSRFADFR